MLPLLLAVQLVDSTALARVANVHNVPPEVFYAIAYMETRDGRKVNDYVGPGREQCDSQGCHRTCRERGRMQINPCIRWGYVVCDSAGRNYDANLHCAAAIIAGWYRRYGDWTLVIKRYNGNGPMADRYLAKALEYIGKRRIAQLNTLPDST